MHGCKNVRIMFLLGMTLLKLYIIFANLLCIERSKGCRKDLQAAAADVIYTVAR